MRSRHQQDVAAIKSRAEDVMGDSDDPAYIAWMLDVDGQVTMAVESDKEYRRWGRHYLPSLQRSHSLQQCANFKDPGLQVYGGTVFRKTRDAGTEAFHKLPAPVSRAVPVDMHRYYNASGGCVGGDCAVALHDGSSKLMRELVKGDVIKSSEDTGATVVCVVQTTASYVCQFAGGLSITPYHPINHPINHALVCIKPNRWTFPVHHVVPELNEQTVYTVVVSGGTTMHVSGIECAVLGHGLEGPVIEHPYFGTNKVVDDLKRFDGYTTGHVRLSAESYVRDDSGRVCGLNC